MTDLPAEARPFSVREWLNADHAKATIAVSALVLAISLAIAFSRFSLEPWMDEFNVIATTLPGFTLHDFYQHALRGQHPLLYEGLLFIGQHSGVTDPIALRLINLLGLPLALGAIWIARRRGAITTMQGATIVALYASSANFLIYLATLRPYFILFSAGIALALAWRLVWRRTPPALGLWLAALTIFVNLHYFATLLGGFLTLVLMIDRARARRWREAALIAILSLIAASPALAMGVLQESYTTGGGVLYYYPTGLAHGLSMIDVAIIDAIAANIPVVFFCAIAALAVAKQKEARQAESDIIVLAATILTYFALALCLHLIKPMLYERYLIGAAGMTLVIFVILGAGPRAPKIAPLAIGVCALISAGITFYSGGTYPSWTKSAAALERVVQKCPTTKIYAVPYARVSNGAVWAVPLNPTEIEARSYGYRYYGAHHNFTYTELSPGAVVTAAPGPCPTLIWIEHFWPTDPTAEDLLHNLEITANRATAYEQLGTGVIVMVRPPR